MKISNGSCAVGVTVPLLLVLAACSAGSGPISPGSVVTIQQLTPEVTIDVTPAAPAPGSAAMITWTSSNATSCMASGSWSGAQVMSNSSGVTTGPLATGTYTYGLTCTGAGGSNSALKTVVVGPAVAPDVSFHIQPSQIRPGDSATLTWSSSNATSCVGSEGTGTDGWAQARALSDADGVRVGPISAVGDYSYTLTCTGPGGTSSDSRILSVSTAAPLPAPSITFDASPAQIQPGDSTTITWNATNATSCAASGGTGSDGWGGTKAVSSTGTQVGPVNGSGSYTYTLTCSGAGGSSSASKLVVVTSTPQSSAPQIQISVDPETISSGMEAFVAWTTTNADSCTASGSWSGSKPLSGSAVSTGTLGTAGVYSYTLTCSGPAGNATGTAVLNVTAPPASLAALTATPTSILAGQSTTLAWSSNDATTCEATGGSPSDGWAGTKATASLGTTIGPINAAGTYTFTLACTGPGGSSGPRSATVVVSAATPAAVIESLGAVPNSIQTGQSTSLQWATSNATECTASGGTGSDGWNGSVATSSSGLSVGPINAAGSYTYTLTCTGPGGGSGPASVNVTVGSATPPASVLTFQASPTSILAGGTTSLSWTTSHASSCLASGGSGLDSWNGSKPVSSSGTTIGPLLVPGTYVYTLSCAGAGGSSGPASVTVTVAPVVALPVIVSLNAIPNDIMVGQTTLLAWATTDATSCTASGGTGSDGWGGPVAASNVGLATSTINVAGTYTYSLTCAGPGGSSGTSSATVNVGPGTPPASIGGFQASPAILAVGDTTSLSWTTANATSCTASGGTGSDGWNGTVPTSSTGTTIGPINSAGVYLYTLSCSGAGGSSGPSSALVTVVAPPPPAIITGLLAIPNSLQTGQSFTLTWASLNATSCTASGGSGSDGWGGTVGTVSVGTVIGPLNSVGTYTYNLTCSGPGGTSAPAGATVTVGPATPPASVLAFLATPSAVLVGQSSLLTWASLNATSCSASGGTGSDGWPGMVAPTSVGTQVGPFATAGTYTYTLNCSGSGGSSGPHSVLINVTTLTPAATVTSLSAAPSSVQVGQSVAISWTSANALSCAASGGSGSDGWGGTVATSGTNAVFGPLTQTGTFTYTLTCSGLGGAGPPSSATVTVNAAPVGAPSITLLANDANPAQIQPGQTVSLRWSTTNATSCTASGGTGSDGWPGTKATSSPGVSVGTISVPGIYTYTLNCSGPGGTTAASVVVTAVSSTSADCGIDVPTIALRAPSASVSTALSGLCLVGCSVTNASRVIDATPDNFATMNMALGVAATESLRVTDGSTTYPAGRKAGFLIAQPGQQLTLGALQQVIVRTLLNGAVQESATFDSQLQLGAIGLLSNPEEGFLGFDTTRPFNAVRIDLSSVASTGSTMNVYGACVGLQ